MPKRLQLPNRLAGQAPAGSRADVTRGIARGGFAFINGADAADGSNSQRTLWEGSGRQNPYIVAGSGITATTRNSPKGPLRSLTWPSTRDGNQRVIVAPSGGEFNADQAFSYFGLVRFTGGTSSDEFQFFATWTGSQSNSYTAVSSTALDDGAWHTVAITYRQGNGRTIDFYLDGAQIHTATPSASGSDQILFRYDTSQNQFEAAVGTSGIAPGRLELGSAEYLTTEPWEGDMAFAGFWTRYLSAAEIYSLHLNPWQVYRRYDYLPASTSVPINIAANVEALTISENAATVDLTGSYINAAVEALNITESVATVNAETAISANAEALDLTESAATVSLVVNNYTNPDMGRWTGGTTSLIPGTTWAAPNALFPTEARNDNSAYTWTSSTSTLTLPSTIDADGFLFIARFEYEDTSNGRHMPSGRIQQASGTGNFVGGATGGYNRDTSEDRAYVSCWAFVDGPSASSTYQFEWSRDSDAPTGGTVRSSFDVIPMWYTNIGMYASTNAGLYGGTTPNQVTGWSVTTESDTAAIQHATNVVTVKGDNKRYLLLGSQWFDGRGASRTQRWHGFEIDGSKVDAAKAYTYYRNSTNDRSGEMFTHLIETATADVTVEQFCYRGDGVTAGAGGADVDGSTPSAGDHTMVVIELHDDAEVFHTVDNTGGVDLNVAGPVDQVLCRTAAITFNDSPSWTRHDDNAMNAVLACDALFGANISAAQEVVSTTSRWTSEAELTVNGTEDTNVFAGDYARNDQGSEDTFGWSANLMGFRALTAGDDVGVSVQELSGGEDGGQFEVQANWSGFWGINLDRQKNVAGTAISAATESLTVAESQATTALAKDVQTAVESLAITESQATTALDKTVSANSESLALSESAATAQLNKDVQTATESLSVAESQATTALAKDVQANTEALAIAESQADVQQATAISANAESLDITEDPATVALDKAVTANTESLALTESQATAELGKDVQAAAESLDVTESQATVTQEYSLAANPESLNVTEDPASVALDKNVAANAESLNLTEHQAAQALAKSVEANQEALQVAEDPATVALDVGVDAATESIVVAEQSAAVSSGTGIGASAEALTVSESQADVQQATDISAGTESLAVTEAQADVQQATAISAGTEALTIATSAGTVRLAKAISAALEDIRVNPQSATTALAKVVSANTESVLITPNQATVQLASGIAAVTEALGLTENVATVNAERVITAGLESLSLASHTGNVALAKNIQAVAESLQVTELSGLVLLSKIVNASVEALTIAENAANVTQGVNIQGTTESLEVQAFQASMALDVTIAAAQEAISLAENAATTQLLQNTDANTESLSVTENAATVVLDKAISAALEQIEISEDAALVTLTVAIQALQEQFNLTEAQAAVAVTGTYLNAAVEGLTLQTLNANVVVPIGVVIRALTGIYLDNRTLTGVFSDKALTGIYTATKDLTGTNLDSKDLTGNDADEDMSGHFGTE